MDQKTAELLVSQFPHWHHKFEIYQNVITPGSYDPRFMLKMLDLPVDLKGKKILDIGASNGFFSLEFFKRGAEVTAVDYISKEKSGFSIMEEISGVSINHVVASVYDIGSSLGDFDIVLFLGVIYHLPDILSALWKVRKICKGTLYLESYVENFEIEKPMLRYYESDSLGGDITNFWAPNVECMESMLRDCSFNIIKTHKWGDRALIKAESIESYNKVESAYRTFF